jgi:hypothetical protein
MTAESTVFDAAFEYRMNGMSEESARVAASEDEAKDARIAELEAALTKIANTPAHHAGQTVNEHFFQVEARAALKANP